MLQKKHRSDYPNKLEYFREEGFKSYEDCAKVITYWQPKSRGQQFNITGCVKKIPDVNYDKLVNRKWAVSQLKNKLYTQKGKLRQKYIDMPQWISYLVSSLMLYFNQCTKEGSVNVLLSWQEYNWLCEK